jgi:aspartyl-tRNA(Asn)/glutamyl-tRNA(Gln) amidotransferase subunit A
MPVSLPESIAAAASLLAEGRVRSTDLLDACLERIRSREPELNAFILVTEEEARKEARQADEELARGRSRGPLQGIPISVKDLIDVRQQATTAGSRVRQGHVAHEDAPVVASLRRAGAVLIGKCNLHEFAFGTTNEDSAYGPARNPHDPRRSPGGSSGGSAAAVMSGMCFASIGTDTGGSIRIPAAACGAVGLKGTFGEIPCDGVVPLSASLDHVGPIARSVTDAALVFAALRNERAPARITSEAGPPTAFKAAVPRRHYLDRLDPTVRRVFDDGLDRLGRSGVQIDEVEIAHAGDVPAVYLHIVLPEAAELHAHTLATRPEDYTAPVRARLQMAQYVLAEDYVRALRGREVIRRDVDTALAGRDVLILPTLPIAAPLIGATTVDVGGGPEPVRNLMLRLTQTFNVTGHPAVSLPAGTLEGGLPFGLQLVGHRGRTWDLVGAARSCERRLASR